MTEVSKLPESAVCPSEEIAIALTGPPWPRNGACAPADAVISTPASSTQAHNVSERGVEGKLITPDDQLTEAGNLGQ
jgi:hypothetical protein